MKIEIEKTLVIGTGHIREEDNRWLASLDKDQVDLVLDKFEYGWRIKITDEIDLRIPKPIQDCIGFGRSHNCDWIAIDRDGLQYEGLEVFDW